MKNSIKIVFLILLFAGVQSCTDVLNDPAPSLSTSQVAALGTAEGVKAVRAYMYALLHSFDYTTEYMLAPAALADNLFNRPPKTRFKDKALNAPGNTTNSWETSYEIIQQANLIIDAVDEGVLPPDLYTQYRGEAFFMRAFAMHHLARTYGYEPGQLPDFGPGDDFNLSIVIRTDPIMGAQDASFSPRSTILETYNQIESDLLEAISLLSKGGAGINFANRAAAGALLARVYLYWGKYDLADQYAAAALQHSPARLATPSEVGTLFNAGSSIEVIFRTLIANPAAESQGVDNALASYTSTQYLPLVPTQDLMDLYSVNDARLAWFAPCFDESSANAPAPNCLATHPAIANGTEPHELQKWNGDLGNYADHVPLLRAAEMVLIQAEARLHTQGPAAAVARLNVLRNSRGLADYSGGTSQDEVLQAILNARRREFVGEGMRFFDLKRLGRGIRKAPGTVNQFVQPVQYSNRKILAELPTSEIALSHQAVENGIIPADSVLVQNQGYINR